MKGCFTSSPGKAQVYLVRPGPTGVITGLNGKNRTKVRVDRTATRGAKTDAPDASGRFRSTKGQARNDTTGTFAIWSAFVAWLTTGPTVT
jgi:hypothetical protein